LYALFFVVPLAGWGYSSASGFPVVWFGVLPLPDWVPVDRRWADALKAVHKAAALMLALLATLHVVAALKHHLLDRDGLLHRMHPFGR
jgi:cytochrome b561